MDVKGKLDLAVGGQALIEGVMMRSPSCVAIAVRRPDGTIVIKKKPFKAIVSRVKFLGIPVLRGIVGFLESIIIGMKALNFSAQEALGDRQNAPAATKTRKIIDSASFTLSVIVSLLMAIFLFKFVPLFATGQLQKVFPQIGKSTLLFNATDGVIRIFIFLSYIFILSRVSIFKRVFEYHGAEHKSIFTYEKGLSLTAENVKPQSKHHPRCGTSFIVIMLFISIIILSFVPRNPVFLINFLHRLSIVPLIMGVGYEILKFSARWREKMIMKALTYPGLMTQRLTTKEPDEKQMEVALAALKAAIES
ncbi:DUF1385 domain-containing protein [Candidatus Peregrinibacteria bacterium]|nr:DUF1385 domain-containing protein [Candidatus Peregrinibacteria bacterium]